MESGRLTFYLPHVATNILSPFVEFGLVIKYEYKEIVWPRDPSWMPPEGEWRPLERSAALLGQFIEIVPKSLNPRISRAFLVLIFFWVVSAAVWISRSALYNPRA
jgi:hypothetical protein